MGNKNEEAYSYKQQQQQRRRQQGAWKKGMGRKKGNQHAHNTDHHPIRSNTFKNPNASQPRAPPVIRKQVDPEMSKYFSEIANLFESGEVELEERSVICGNALEEARGKEFELVTDYIISHNMQTLLEGCDVDHLCSFLRSCAKVFPLIAMDRSGSHVAETALKSLAQHLEGNDSYIVIEETLNMLCKVIGANLIDMMCNRYGSHVLRSFLCLCGGVPLDSLEYHGVKPSTILAERLNLGPSRRGGNDSSELEHRFPDLLKSIATEILKLDAGDIKILLVDQYSSLVLQTVLKLLVGHEKELMEIIPILFGCKKETVMEGKFLEMEEVGDVLELMKETGYSHLMEVILGVTPQSLYDEMFTKVFRNSLFELSSHHCCNFVIQSLISHARDQGQMELIWEELGPKFKDLLETGRSGVIASLIAASQRLHTHEDKCCQALAASVLLPDEPPKCIVPRVLFLESYIACENRSNWRWPDGVKMHVMGSLILQAIFRFQSELIQPYITSLTSLEVDHVFQAAKDAAGAHVIEAFLGCNASAKHKRRLIMKLRGYFGELAMISSGSFTVEKCFAASNVSLREAIVSDLLAVQTELSKTKHGSYLIRKLDVDGFGKRPDQWRSKQASKQSVYGEFVAAFGSNGEKTSESDCFLANASKKTSFGKEMKKMRVEIDHRLASEKHGKQRGEGEGEGEGGGELEKGLNKVVPFLSGDMKGRKRVGKYKTSKHSKKKKLKV